VLLRLLLVDLASSKRLGVDQRVEKGVTVVFGGSTGVDTGPVCGERAAGVVIRGCWCFGWWQGACVGLEFKRSVAVGYDCWVQ